MKIGLIDVELNSRKHHNFPNLALMKLSGYYKEQGHEVKLITFGDISPNVLFNTKYDKVFISKVFTTSFIPENILKLPFVEYGGSGFMYEKDQIEPDFFKTPQLPTEIEHHFPDYHLYDDWIKSEIRFTGRTKDYFKNYTDYSIGFTTRGCFRQCDFCFNRGVKTITLHSPLSEFVDKSRKKIVLLDDNIFGARKYWKDIFIELQQTNKPFYYNQGLDIRLLTEEKASVLAQSKYAGDYIFAFDNYKDKKIIIEKIEIFKKYLPTKVPKFYIFCAFDYNNVLDKAFWKKDVEEVFERLKILMQYKCIPYIMKYEKWRKSPYSPLYSALSSWCNQPANFKKMSFLQAIKNNTNLSKFKRECPDVVEKYFKIRYDES
jgi:hypothetical protein